MGYGAVVMHVFDLWFCLFVDFYLVQYVAVRTATQWNKGKSTKNIHQTRA
jgi:hypothetical protein